jgi:hypothetical protein
MVRACSGVKRMVFRSVMLMSWRTRMEARKKNPAAVALGRRGGKASAERLTEEQRKEKARKAAKVRWTKRQH